VRTRVKFSLVIILYLFTLESVFAQSTVKLLRSRRRRHIIEVSPGGHEKGMILKISDNDSQISRVKVLGVSKSGKLLLVVESKDFPLRKVCYFHCVDITNSQEGNSISYTKSDSAEMDIGQAKSISPVSENELKNYFGVNWGVINNYEEKSGAVSTAGQFDLLINGYYDRELLRFSKLSLSSGVGVSFAKNQIVNLPASYLIQPYLMGNLNISVFDHLRFFIGGNLNYSITTDLQYVDNGTEVVEEYENVFGFGFQAGALYQFSSFYIQLFLQSNLYSKVGKDSLSNSENQIESNLSTVGLGVGFNF